MQHASTFGRFLVTALVFLGISWAVYSFEDMPRYPAGHVFYEKIPRYQTALIAPTFRIDTPSLWPQTVGLRSDIPLTSSPAAKPRSTSNKTPSDQTSLARQWVAALSAGVVSVAIGLLLVSASGARLVWIYDKF